jgi:transcription elongation factor/antiterminator RfaH
MHAGNVSNLSDWLSWYVIHTKPRHEQRAEDNLRAWQLETFYPKLRERCYTQHRDQRSYMIKALFPGYIFARFNANESLHKVRFTRGVHSVVSFGVTPTPVDDTIIEIITSQQDADGFVKIGEDFHAGDKVAIQDGPLKDFAGIFERTLNDEERVSVLLTTVNYQGRVLIEKRLLKKVS